MDVPKEKEAWEQKKSKKGGDSVRLINADALRKDVLDLPNCYNGFSDTYDKACIIGVIDEQPTIEERKKGEWIPAFGGKFTGGAYWFSCSECKRIVPEVRNGGWNFCPNCGARMEETDAVD